MQTKYPNHISCVYSGFMPRVGFGYDVHAFGDGDYIVLCGVKIPHTRGFVAHSDGDVALHAVADALYGANADGDIGQHFPPSDDKYSNMDSSIFLQHACNRIRKQHAYIGNIDITIVAEAPKIAPHCIAMRQNISKVLHIPTEAVSVKATTSESMGFIGRKQGIAVYAVAIIFSKI